MTPELLSLNLFDIVPVSNSECQPYFLLALLMENLDSINKSKSKRGGYREGSGSQPVDFEPRRNSVKLTDTELEMIKELRKQRGLTR